MPNSKGRRRRFGSIRKTSLGEFQASYVGPDGRRMVPHFLAVDVASDNRILPGQSWSTDHRFAAACLDPQVTALLVHRPLPTELAAERGYVVQDAVMARVTR